MLSLALSLSSNSSSTTVRPAVCREFRSGQRILSQELSERGRRQEQDPGAQCCAPTAYTECRERQQGGGCQGQQEPGEFQGLQGTHITRFPSRKVQILTQKAMVGVRRVRCLGFPAALGFFEVRFFVDSCLSCWQAPSRVSCLNIAHAIHIFVYLCSRKCCAMYTYYYCCTCAMICQRLCY